MRRLSGVLVLSLWSSIVFAQTSVVRTPIFISPDQLAVAAVLSSPPADNASQTRAELAELLKIQETRTTEQIARARKDEAEEDIFIFRDILGERFTQENLPLTAVLSSHVHNDESVIVNPAKASFGRFRPYFFDAAIKPVCKVSPDTSDYSFPSGHATSGYLEAFVAMLLVPEKRDAILARADEYAHNRLVCGVHYPTDIAASKAVAYAMIGLMMNNPQFKKELEAAKAETRTELRLSQ